MKHKIIRFIKIIISFGYVSILMLKQLLKKTVFQNTYDSLIVLYYHSVPTALLSKFNWQLDFILKQGKIVHIDYVNEKNNNGKLFAISFDDGLTSVLYNAMPEIKKRNIPITIFFPTAYIGKTPSWDIYGEKISSYEMIMNEEQILSLESDMLKIGSHSVNHKKLSQIPYQEQVSELQESKSSLEKIINKEVSLFSYPYGDFNTDILRISKNVGYQKVYSSIPGYSSIKSKRNGFLRGRVSVDSSDFKIEFVLKVFGGYNWMHYYLTLKKRLTRLTRRT